MPWICKQRPPRRRERDCYRYPARPISSSVQSCIVEIGPGRGDFLFHLAEEHPDASIIGIEIKGKRVDKLIRRIEKRHLRNVSIVQDDARFAIPELFTERSLDEIHIQFPDPWPKRRHAKHRSMSPSFVQACLRVLKPNGMITFITDERSYAEAVAEIFVQIPEVASCYEPTILTDLPDAFPTFFAQKWQAQGRTIAYQKYRRA